MRALGFVAAWVLLAAAIALLSLNVTNHAIALLIRSLAENGIAGGWVGAAGRSLGTIVPSALEGLLVAAYCGGPAGLRWALATFAGLVAGVVLVALLAPVFNPPARAPSPVGYIVLQGMAAFVSASVQWLAVLRRRGDEHGLWVAVVVVATLVDVSLSLTLLLPRPPAGARSVVAIAWPGLLISALATGGTLAWLLEPQPLRQRIAGGESRKSG